MKDLYLRSVNFENFRTFGEFEVPVVPAPGLTLLVGTNGLGKSSFFDALEWGLTGEVRRFKSHMGAANQGKYLTRRGAVAGSHTVRLDFNTDDGAIVRGPGSDPSSADVIRLLKKASWSADVQDVATYLAFTHFLGQAAQQRFTSRERGEQWESLKGPSGIDRLDEVRNGLRGKATEMAFTRRVNKEAGAIKDAERLLAEWRDLTTRLTRLRDASDASGGMQADLFNTRLSALTVSLSGLSPDFATGKDASPSSQLIAIKAELDRLRLEASSRRVALDGLADIPARYAAEAAIADPDAASLAEAQATWEREDAALAAALAATTASQELVQTRSAALAGYERDIEALEAIRSDLNLVARTTPALALHQSEREKLDATLSRDRLRVSGLTLETAAIRARRASLAGLVKAAQAASALADHARRLPDLRARSLASAMALANLNEPDVRARLTKVLEERNLLKGQVESARAAVNSARGRASEIAAAVASIAGHLHDDDRACPVCLTSFDPGQLRLIAEEAANAQDANLARAERDYGDLGRRLGLAETSVADAEASLRAVEQAREQARTAAAALAEVETDILGQLATEGVDPEAAVLAAERRALDELSAAQAIGSGDDARLAEATASGDGLRATIAELEAQLAGLVFQITELANDKLSAEERLLAADRATATVEQITIEIQTVRERLSEASSSLAEAQEMARHALELQTATQARHESARDALQRLQTARSTAADASRALAARWSHGGLPGLPRAEALQAALQSAGNLTRAIERLEDERMQLLAAVEIAARDQELRDIAAQMNARGGEGAAEEPATYETVLVGAVDAATNALALTEAAHSAVDAFANKLRDEARSFSTQFLTPLNGLIGDFNEALLSTPGETVQLNAAYYKDRTQFAMGLHYRDPLDDAIYDTALPPQVVLSEGQLAANGFSILCAASTAYPWSRWRALLMDDPLQHNDIIHAAAFVDLMRNLVELQGYQLIMSSHDRSEADFIRRKFDAAGLPCSVITLTAPSKAGVRYLPPEHNGPAKAFLASEPEAA